MAHIQYSDAGWRQRISRTLTTQCADAYLAVCAHMHSSMPTHSRQYDLMHTYSSSMRTHIYLIEDRSTPIFGAVCKASASSGEEEDAAAPEDKSSHSTSHASALARARNFERSPFEPPVYSPPLVLACLRPLAACRSEACEVRTFLRKPCESLRRTKSEGVPLTS